MICDLCESVFRKREGNGDHHKSTHHLESAAESGCLICLAILDSILGWKGDIHTTFGGRKWFLTYEFVTFETQQRLQFESFPDLPDTPENFDDFDLDDLDDFEARHFDLGPELRHSFAILPRCSEFDSPPEKLHLIEGISQKTWQARDDGLRTCIPTSTGHPDVTRVAQKWLEMCMRSHGLCDKNREADWFPDRLLDLTGDEPRLLLTDTVEPLGPYATLSHCWGPEPSFFMLTATNLEAMQTRIPLAQLPKTFSDAIETTKRLGLRYLWIDSLCIIQSGEGAAEDWQKQSAAMAQVYSNCIVNISAGRAANPNDGCFTERDPSLIQPCIVRWHAFGADEGDYDVVDLHLTTGRATLPLSSRAWVLQERLLSPRVLHFGTRKIFWECSELQNACETYPNGPPCEIKTLNSIPFTLQAPKDPTTGKRATTKLFSPGGLTLPWLQHPEWCKILYTYTRCSLTRPDEDKFMALAGIAERQAAILEDYYVAGFFRGELLQTLSWQVHTDNLTKAQRSVTYRAPTWSWASMDGPVEFVHHNFENGVSSVVDLKIELVDKNNKCGQIRYAELTLCGFVASVSWDPSIPKGDSPEVEIEGDGPTLDSADTSIAFDGLSALQTTQTGTIIFVINASETFAQGLVLKPVVEETDKYVRLGTWLANGEGILQGFQKLGQKVVTII